MPLIALLLLMGCCTAAVAEPVTEARLQHAIAAMQAYLWRSQQQDGSWDNRQHDRVGLSALVTLSLLSSGESSQSPAMRRAVDYLRTATSAMTYSCSTRAQAWSYLPDDYLPELRRDAQWLVNAADGKGQWSYDDKPGGYPNHSTTHFAVLGLWEASRRGVSLSRAPWQRAQLHFQTVQNSDGGWGYAESSPSSTGSMTAAGLSVLLGAQQVLQREMVSADPRLAASIAAGMGWLDRHFAGGHNPPHGGWDLYYLFALERVALASGVRYFRQRDWFLEGAQFILLQQRLAPGSPDAGSLNHSPVDTAFALIFLSRGRVPVWISKLNLPQQPTHRRPHDVYYLNQYLSRLREGDMNWQLITPDDPLDGWLATPVLYLSSHTAVQFSAQQKLALKAYLFRGGTLVANTEEGSKPFAESIAKLCEELFPQWPIARLTQEHPLFSSLHRIEADRSPSVQAVHNGARDLVILLDRDMGYVWQADLEPGKSVSWTTGANLWALLTDRGLLPGRLAQQPVFRQDRPGSGQSLVVGRVWYDGNWCPEPAALRVLGDLVFNQSGIDVKVLDVDVRDLPDPAPPLLVLAGTHESTLSPELYARLALYVQKGGTLLVETVGGRGTFAREVEQRLGMLLNTAAVQLAATHPIISGMGLPGGTDNARASYRRYAVSTLSLRPWPRLAAIFLDQRPAVIISTEDLSLGLLDVPRYGVIGYASTSARQIMTNLMLWMHQQAAAPMAPSRPTPVRVPYQAIEAERRNR